MYVRKEAVLSSQIEGTQASLIDVLEFEAHAIEPGRPQDVAEVVNYVAAMNYGLERLKSLPISLRLIREIHARLMQGVRGSEHHPGEFRHSQNWIGPPGCTLRTATFVPPPIHEMEQALDNLERFLHDETPMPALIKVGLAHAQFETIHPFLDGNQGSRRPGRLLKFFLRGVHAVAQEATATARQIVDLRETHRELITKRLNRGAGRALALLETLYERPVISVHRVQEVTDLTFANANTLVKQLSDLGLLQEITGKKRNRVFAYEPYLSLFKDPFVEPPDIQ